MTQEEKAKAYDGNYKTYTELINRLEDVKNAIKKQNYGIAMDILCKPYPEYQITASSELKESEDERIRKATYNCVKWFGFDSCFFKDVSQEECLAWLEKKPSLLTKEKALKNSPFVEQKPAWSEEDEDNMMMIEDRLSDYLDYIREDTSLTKHQKNSMKEEVIGYVNWLKSIKDRVQPQSTWKPSEEQIKALEAMLTVSPQSPSITSALIELRQQLKKLREE